MTLSKARHDTLSLASALAGGASAAGAAATGASRTYIYAASAALFVAFTEASSAYPS